MPAVPTHDYSTGCGTMAHTYEMDPNRQFHILGTDAFIDDVHVQPVNVLMVLRKPIDPQARYNQPQHTDTLSRECSRRL